MFQLKLQEFEFIRKSAENIFFVAHRQKETAIFIQKIAVSFVFVFLKTFTKGL